MKRTALLLTVCLAALTGLPAGSFADQNLDLLDEKIKRLTTLVEDLEFRQKKLEEDLTGVKGDIETLRKAGGAVSPSDIRALEDRIAAVDSARKKDKEAIIDQLAKELAAISSGKPVSSKHGTGTATGSEHTVQKGDNLSSIARQYGVKVADLKKANNLTSDSLVVGQKLVIPQK